MDPTTMLASKGVQGAISLITELIASGQEDQAQEIYRQASEMFGPDFAPKLQRVVPPELVSEWANAQEDSNAKDAQSRILSQLEDEYSSGGMTPADQAAMTLARETGDAEASSANATIQQNLAQRGGSGQINAYLQQGAAQDAANRTGKAALQEQAAARERALRALEGGGSLAGQMRNQSAAFMGNRANAMDDVNQFNAHMGMDAAQFNAGQQQQEYMNGRGERDRKSGAMGDYAQTFYRQADRTRRQGKAAGDFVSGAMNGTDEEEDL
jgi:hypothetical protein